MINFLKRLNKKRVLGLILLSPAILTMSVLLFLITCYLWTEFTPLMTGITFVGFCFIGYYLFDSYEPMLKPQDLNLFSLKQNRDHMIKNRNKFITIMGKAKYDKLLKLLDGVLK